MLVPYPARSNRTIFILVATALPGIGQYTYVETLTEYGQGVMNVTQPKLVFYNDKKTPQTNFSHLLQQYTVKGNILHSYLPHNRDREDTGFPSWSNTVSIISILSGIGMVWNYNIIYYYLVPHSYLPITGIVILAHLARFFNPNPTR